VTVLDRLQVLQSSAQSSAHAPVCNGAAKDIGKTNAGGPDADSTGMFVLAVPGRRDQHEPTVHRRLQTTEGRPLDHKPGPIMASCHGAQHNTPALGVSRYATGPNVNDKSYHKAILTAMYFAGGYRCISLLCIGTANM